MKLAFCLFKYFPYGGLERDFLRIAECCRARGHQVHVYTMAWEGQVPDEFHVTLVPADGVTNHGRCASFVRNLARLLPRREYDAVIGFNQMPGLDIYYAADICYKAQVERRRGPWYRWTPRYQVYSTFEREVFAPERSTVILLISERERENFIRCYGTPESRFHLLPPGVAPDRRIPSDSSRIRREVRAELAVGNGDRLLLMVGTDYKKKGVDRSIQALASLPEEIRRSTNLLVVGKNRNKCWTRCARRLGIEQNVCFLGERSDVPRFLLAADILLHPAYSENTGTVLLEALVAGLPVLATDVCGYAFHIERAGSGLVVPSPFEQQDLDRKLLRMLTSEERDVWRRRALEYTEKTDLFSLVDRAAAIIEEVARAKVPAS